MFISERNWRVQGGSKNTQAKKNLNFKTSDTKKESSRHIRTEEVTRRTARKKRRTPLGTAFQETGFKSVEEHREKRFSAKLLRERERRCSKTGPKETIRSRRGTHET
ncbi:hypothetical protein NPIL_240791 [Nephila pilipes]|uniref:Uncharacterized protein n=1 Tax=Nephila pilipes TaxID=299642 RepID=A0A8X6QR62_NEPPI|nr:hypothetical protein NPIL_240791 [Nephila pilipes]